MSAFEIVFLVCFVIYVAVELISGYYRKRLINLLLAEAEAELEKSKQRHDDYMKKWHGER